MDALLGPWACHGLDHSPDNIPIQQWLMDAEEVRGAYMHDYLALTDIKACFIFGPFYSHPWIDAYMYVYLYRCTIAYNPSNIYNVYEAMDRNVSISIQFCHHIKYGHYHHQSTQNYYAADPQI